MQPHIVLVGLRGTGKTTVAKLVAGRLEIPWVDADPEIEEAAGKTIREIFAEQGETVFRDLEVEVTGKLLEGEPQVVAAGGGVVLREENRGALQGHRVVWLKGSPEVLYERIQGDSTTQVRRPDLTDSGGLNEFRELLAIRAPLYRAVATWEIDTDGKSPDQVASEIVSLLESG